MRRRKVMKQTISSSSSKSSSTGNRVMLCNRCNFSECYELEFEDGTEAGDGDEDGEQKQEMDVNIAEQKHEMEMMVEKMERRHDQQTTTITAQVTSHVHQQIMQAFSLGGSRGLEGRKTITSIDFYFLS